MLQRSNTGALCSQQPYLYHYKQGTGIVFSQPKIQAKNYNKNYNLDKFSVAGTEGFPEWCLGHIGGQNTHPFPQKSRGNTLYKKGYKGGNITLIMYHSTPNVRNVKFKIEQNFMNDNYN